LHQYQPGLYESARRLMKPRRARLGLWADDSPVAPWEWRGK
jgi:hypothetical protein